MKGKMLLAMLSMSVMLSGCQHTASSEAQSSTMSRNSAIKSLALLEQPAAQPRELAIEQWTTRSGSQVLFMAAPELPMFDLRLTFAAGSSKDGAQYGLAAMTSAMLDEGTQSKSVDQIAAGFEDLGASFSKGAYRDMAVLSLRSLSQPSIRQPALDLFTEVLSKPSFPQAELQRLKNQMQANFDYQKQNPGALASKALYQKLYADHPYGHPSEGTEQSVAALTRQQLQQFHQQFYSAKNLQIALVGDLTRAEAETIAEQVSSALPVGRAAEKTASAIKPVASKTEITYPSSQTHILMAQLGIERGHPDYAALYVGNQILGGGGFGSRLMEEVREKRGLTYGIYSGFTPMQAAGPFLINVQTRAELSEATQTLVQKIVQTFVQDGPTEQELADAKQEIVGSFPLTAANNAAVVGQLGAIGFYDLPLTWLQDFTQEVQALTVEQVTEAMQRHLQPEQWVIVTAGPKVAQQPLPPAVERASSTTSERQH